MADPLNTTSMASSDNALPVISITNTDDPSPEPTSKHKRASSSSRIEQLKLSSSRVASKLPDKLHELHGKRVESPARMQDRLMNL
jgi:hypothetical protein